MENNPKMAITPKGLRYLLAGLVVMVSGYILMTGGGSDDPEVFHYAMFDHSRYRDRGGCNHACFQR